MPAAAFSVLMYLNANTGEAVKLKVEEDEVELVGKNASLVILASSLQPPTPLPSPQVLGLKTRRLLQPSRRPATQPSVPTPGQARIDEIILYLFNKMFEY